MWWLVLAAMGALAVKARADAGESTDENAPALSRARGGTPTTRPGGKGFQKPQRVTPPKSKKDPGVVGPLPPRSARVYSDYPEPGKWVKLDGGNTKNIIVSASDGSPNWRGIKLVKNAHSIAWRAYMPIKQRAGKKYSYSDWSGLNPLLGSWSGVKTLLGLQDEITAAVMGGTAGDWEGAAKAGAKAVLKGIEGAMDRYDAANRLVLVFLETFMGNIGLHPWNKPKFVDKAGKKSIDWPYITKGTELYIPHPGEIYSGPA